MPRRRPRQDGPQKRTARYRCALCREWKITEEYAPSMLRVITSAPDIDPAKCLMTCRTCSEKPELYLCEGPCGEKKPASSFSKNARRNQVWKCQACTSIAGLQEAYKPVVEKEDLGRLLPTYTDDNAIQKTWYPHLTETLGNTPWGESISTVSSASRSSLTTSSEAAWSNASTAAPLRPSSKADQTVKTATRQMSDWGRPMGAAPASSAASTASGNSQDAAWGAWGAPSNSAPPSTSKSSQSNSSEWSSAAGSERSSQVPKRAWSGQTSEPLTKRGGAPWDKI
ncbi:stc1 domain-containing protein [Sarocladium implicatum]|nr:stc1 domain-containing protein [Sarocladium implicatum]